MPFKTKKEKLAAISRKYNLAETILEKPTLKQSASRTSKSRGDMAYEKVEQIEKNYNFIRNDLWKILLFSSTIIALQLALIFII